MTDGTTGTAGQSPAIAPVASEEDMSQLSALFQRAANAVVAASTLPQQIAALTTEVNEHKKVVERLQASNDAQFNTINELREARNAALFSAEGYKRDWATANAQIEGLQSRAASAETTIAQLNDELERTRKERDEYGLAHMQALDDLKAVRDKLGQVKERFKELLAEPEAKPEPEAAPKQDYHPPQGGMVGATTEWNLPASAPEPLPPEAMPEISPAPDRPEFVDEWLPGYHWDMQTGRYRLAYPK